MFQEWNQAGGDTDHLTRGDVDVLNVCRRNKFEICMETRDDVSSQLLRSDDLAVFDLRVSWSNIGLSFFVRSQPNDVVSDFSRSLIQSRA